MVSKFGGRLSGHTDGFGVSSWFAFHFCHGKWYLVPIPNETVANHLRTD